MTSPSISLEEQFADQRSNQIAYRLTLTTSTKSGFRLMSIEPKVPNGSRLVDIIDTSMSEMNTKRQDIIDELNSTIESYFWNELEDFRDDWIKVHKDAMKKIFSLSGIFRLYSEMIFPFLYSENSFRKQMQRETKKLFFKISNMNDARKAQSNWIDGLPKENNIRKLFAAKVDQLAEIEQRVGKIEDFGIADINSFTPFNSTYVIKFKRSLFETRKYQIGFEIETRENRSNRTINSSQYSTVLISPSPISLSLVAVFAAILGAVVKILVSSSSGILESLPKLDSAQMLVGPIVALIFFNIFEQTSLGKGLSMAVNWRSALLIGALCGLAHERILEALKALIGVQ